MPHIVQHTTQTSEQVEQAIYYSTPEIYLSKKAPQFRAPLRPQLGVQRVGQMEYNGNHSAPGSYPLNRSPQFKVPVTPFPPVLVTPMPPLPTTPFVGIPSTPILNPPGSEGKQGKLKTSRQFITPLPLQLPPQKAEAMTIFEQPAVHAAFPPPLPSTPYPEQHVRSLPLNNRPLLRPAPGKGALYSQEHSTLLGKVQGVYSSGAMRLAFTSIFTRKAKMYLWAYLVLFILFNAAYILWIIQPGHIIFSRDPLTELLLVIGLIAIVGIEFVRIIQGVSLLLFALNAKDPIPLSAAPQLRVAVLTTFVPSKEPIDVLEKTLRAMKAMTYAGTVDVWVLDEGNDPAVRRLAQNLGVFHFSRKDTPHFNQPSGEFKAKTKAGNHNAWRVLYEHAYDVVAQMDPDHTPFPNFLERTLGYFRDSDVAFAVAPQVYGNFETKRLTKAAAAQAFIFHGLIQRGGNGLGAPLLIGTNHLYRPEAWKQIRGYQDSIIEDHLTSITIQGAKNPKTGNQWKGVYTPDILSVGEGPSSWTDYFNQQKRWAYGVWEIILHHDWRLFRKLSLRQRVAYVSLQLFYPGVAVTWLLGSLLLFLYLVLGISSIGANSSVWAALWAISLLNQIALYFGLSGLNLVKHEKVRYGFHAMALTLFTAPIYASAAIEGVLRKKLEYRVTAKGALKTTDELKTFSSHLKWFGLISLFIAIGCIEQRIASAPFGWALFSLAALIAPVLLFLSQKRPAKKRAARGRAPVIEWSKGLPEQAYSWKLTS